MQGSDGSDVVGRAHRPGLDGLRGLAVVAVVGYHLGYLNGGFLGVDVFFVLSGYLITSLALREIGGSGSVGLRAFWGRRIRRLFPALLTMVTVSLAVALALGWPRNRLHELAWDAISTLTWWANWRQANGASYWTSGQDLFRHAWSLSIEEQFYVLWPLALVAAAAAARKLHRNAAVVVGIVAALGAVASGAWQIVLSHRLDASELSRVYVGTDTRVVAPLAGCALACATAWSAGRREPRLDGGGGAKASAARWVSTGAAAAVLAVLVVRAEVASPDLYRQGWLLVAAAAAVVLVSTAARVDDGDRDLVGLALGNRAVRHLGFRSYGIYLWSWPTQVLIRFQWPGISKALLAVVTVAVTLALAELSYRFIEDPLRRRSSWAAAARLRRPAWAAGVVAAVALVTTTLTLAVPPPAHERIDTAASVASALEAPPKDVATSSLPAGARQPLKVLVTGDSVAWTIGYHQPAPDQMPDGIASIDSRAIIGCGLLSVDGWGYPQGGTKDVFTIPGDGACLNAPEAERIGLTAKPDVVLLFPGSWEWSNARRPDGHVVDARSTEMADELTERLMRRITAANDAGARMVIAAYACPGAEAAGVRKDPVFLRWINRLLRTVVRDASKAGHRVELLEPTSEVCVDGNPNGEPTPAKVKATGDEVHIADDAGGAWIWNTWLGPALSRR